MEERLPLVSGAASPEPSINAEPRRGRNIPLVVGAMGAAALVLGTLSAYDHITSQAGVSSPELMQQTACKTTPTEDKGYYKCPSGRYLGHSDADIADRNQRLQRLHETLRSMNYEKNERESDSYLDRGFATYESSVWLKPAECQTLPDEEWSKSNYYLKYKEDNSPDYITKMVNDEHGIEFHLNWKVASTSFPSYLWCEYGTWEDVAKTDNVPRGYTVVSAVRHPVSRFVSSVGELMQRSVNAYCPSGYCTFETDYWQGNTTLDKFAHQTTWYDLVKGGIDMDALPEIMGAFVHDTTCNYYTYASEHFTTQADFVTQNGGCAAPVHVVMRLEDIDDGFQQLADSVGHVESGSCAMEDSNEASDKPGGVPTSGEMLAILEKQDELMRDICMIYAQDFICFDYELPAACEGLF